MQHKTDVQADNTSTTKYIKLMYLYEGLTLLTSHVSKPKTTYSNQNSGNFVRKCKEDIDNSLCNREIRYNLLVQYLSSHII